MKFSRTEPDLWWNIFVFLFFHEVLAEYCREEFAKIRTFLYEHYFFQKEPKLPSFRVKLVNFTSENGCFGCLLQS